MKRTIKVNLGNHKFKEQVINYIPGRYIIAFAITLLEVLEHIPNVGQAIKNACRIASKYIILTVPSKEDDNPEHIHLLNHRRHELYHRRSYPYHLKY